MLIIADRFRIAIRKANIATTASIGLETRAKPGKNRQTF